MAVGKTMQVMSDILKESVFEREGQRQRAGD